MPELNDESGVSDKVSPFSFSPSRASWAREPGERTLEAVTGALAAARTCAAGALAEALGAALVDESHMSGAGAVNTARPPAVVASTVPAAPTESLSRSALTSVFSRVLSSGSAAAAASCTTNTSENPPWAVTDTSRSTPGITLR